MAGLHLEFSVAHLSLFEMEGHQVTKSDTGIPASQPAERQEDDRRSVLDYVDPVDPILTTVVRHDAPCQAAVDSAVDAASEVKAATLGETAGAVLTEIVGGIVDNIDI